MGHWKISGTAAKINLSDHIDHATWINWSILGQYQMNALMVHR
ncbi:hypothetical protein OCF65_28395 [Bacillus toyonensis]|nr:hypothetical protein [Bacillus toyonensis]MCU4770224.1 hypothetical protein [Bacillus toyonensis]MCU5584289.1 hypothetical protein [Bacillus toyonensis]MED2846347.1 hypothetical protein [Bacillus toyonensis]